MAGSRLCRPFAVPPCRMARREWQESMGNTECVHIMSLCKQNTGRETVEIRGSGPVGFCGKLGRPLRREADSVWKTLWKMFITYCTKKLLVDLCELLEQKIDGEGNRSPVFLRRNFAKFVEFCGSREPARRAGSPGWSGGGAYLTAPLAKNTSGYHTAGRCLRGGTLLDKDGPRTV